VDHAVLAMRRSLHANQESALQHARLRAVTRLAVTTDAVDCVPAIAQEIKPSVLAISVLVFQNALRTSSAAKMDAGECAAIANRITSAIRATCANVLRTALARSVVTMDAVDRAVRATQTRIVFLVRVNAFRIALANSAAMMDAVVCAAAQAWALSA
jgi:hypothetical protein